MLKFVHPCDPPIFAASANIEVYWFSVQGRQSKDRAAINVRLLLAIPLKSMELALWVHFPKCFAEFFKILFARFLQFIDHESSMRQAYVPSLNCSVSAAWFRWLDLFLNYWPCSRVKLEAERRRCYAHLPFLGEIHLTHRPLWPERKTLLWQFRVKNHTNIQCFSSKMVVI